LIERTLYHSTLILITMALSGFLSSSIVFYTIVAFAFLLLRHFAYATDTPYIKNLTQIHGWPVFGSLIELGETHAKVFGEWSKRYGPVFQVRLGNKVRARP
jgi:phenylacetate 2-hydroxylase